MPHRSICSTSARCPLARAPFRRPLRNPLRCVDATTVGPRNRTQSLDTFEEILNRLPHAYRITLVGLGEPLLHPDVIEMVALGARYRRHMGLVTNAMLLDGDLGDALVGAGMASIAFSVDAATPETMAEVRAGGELSRIIDNIRAFSKRRKTSPDVSMAVFCAVSLRTLPELPDLVRIVSELGVHVMVLTDLNFRENVSSSLSSADPSVVGPQTTRAIREAFARGLPVLQVSAIEQFGLASRYSSYLLLRPHRLFSRSHRRINCYSPWQTIPIAVDGSVTLCDCQPDQTIGNILREPLGSLWNGEVMREFRNRQQGDDPPAACRACPRF